MLEVTNVVGLYTEIIGRSTSESISIINANLEKMWFYMDLFLVVCTIQLLAINYKLITENPILNSSFNVIFDHIQHVYSQSSRDEF